MTSNVSGILTSAVQILQDIMSGDLQIAETNQQTWCRLLRNVRHSCGDTGSHDAGPGSVFLDEVIAVFLVLDALANERPLDHSSLDKVLGPSKALVALAASAKPKSVPQPSGVEHLYGKVLETIERSQQRMTESIMEVAKAAIEKKEFSTGSGNQMTNSSMTIVYGDMGSSSSRRTVAEATTDKPLAGSNHHLIPPLSSKDVKAVFGLQTTLIPPEAFVSPRPPGRATSGPAFDKLAKAEQERLWKRDKYPYADLTGVPIVYSAHSTIDQEQRTNNGCEYIARKLAEREAVYEVGWKTHIHNLAQHLGRNLDGPLPRQVPEHLRRMPLFLKYLLEFEMTPAEIAQVQSQIQSRLKVQQAKQPQQSHSANAPLIELPTSTSSAPEEIEGEQLPALEGEMDTGHTEEHLEPTVIGSVPEVRAVGTCIQPKPRKIPKRSSTAKPVSVADPVPQTDATPPEPSPATGDLPSLTEEVATNAAATATVNASAQNNLSVHSALPRPEEELCDTYQHMACRFGVGDMCIIAAGPADQWGSNKRIGRILERIAHPTNTAHEQYVVQVDKDKFLCNSAFLLSWPQKVPSTWAKSVLMQNDLVLAIWEGAAGTFHPAKVVKAAGLPNAKSLGQAESRGGHQYRVRFEGDKRVFVKTRKELYFFFRDPALQLKG